MTLALLLAVPLVIAVAIGVAAARTMPTTLPPLRTGQVLAAVLLYAAVSAGLYFVIGGNREYAIRILAALLPGVLFGALVRRFRMAAIPVLIAALGFSIAYLQNPSCDGCGELDWFSIIIGSSIFIVAPAVVAVLLGIALRNLLPRLPRASRRTAAPDLARPERG